MEALGHAKCIMYVTDIILMDIIGFSRLSTLEQFVTAEILTDGLHGLTVGLLTTSFLKRDELILGVIPTGDGFYVLLPPRLAGYGLLFGLSLRSAVLTSQFRAQGLFRGVRVAVHTGKIAPFTDVTGKINYVGDGLNDCERLFSRRTLWSRLTVCPDDKNVVIVSDAAHHFFHECFCQSPQNQQFLSTIRYRESRQFKIKDKHGKLHLARYVECSRRVAISPPRPPDLSNRLREIGTQSQTKRVT